MGNKNQYNSSRTRTPINDESYSKEEKNINEKATLAIKGREKINQRHTKTKNQPVHMEKKELRMQSSGPSTKSKAKRKEERDAWIKENIVVTFHKWSEEEEKKIQEKFGSLGLKKETHPHEEKEKEKHVFLWDSNSEDDDDDYLHPMEENFPTHSLHIKYSGFGDVGDFEEVLTLEGGRIIDRQPYEGKDEDDREGEERAHKKGEPREP